jgi:hypothetical protein
MKRAIFAGFTAAMLTATQDIPALSDEAAEEAIESYLRQCKGFFETVAERKA